MQRIAIVLYIAQRVRTMKRRAFKCFEPAFHYKFDVGGRRAKINKNGIIFSGLAVTVGQSLVIIIIIIIRPTRTFA